MTIDPQIAIAVGIPAIVALGWLFRLEARIGKNESEILGLRNDVTYVRQRIDAALSGHFHIRSSDE